MSPGVSLTLNISSIQRLVFSTFLALLMIIDRMGPLRLIDFDQRGNQAEFSAEQIQSCMFLIFSRQSLTKFCNDDKNSIL